MTIITLGYFKSLKITNIVTDIVYNFRYFFSNKSIKYAIFWKIIFGMEDQTNEISGFVLILIGLTYTCSCILRVIIDCKGT